MKIQGGLFFILWLLAFTNYIKQDGANITSREVIKPELQKVLDDAQVMGSILIYDTEKDTYYSNDFARSKRAFIPASTYKIPHTLIALELEIVENESSILEWDGVTRPVENWNQNLTLKEAFHYSCVPCYQQIARQVGVERMNQYVKDFNYGRMMVDSSSLDMFWLEGASAISQFNQIDFLKKLHDSKLPISERTEKIAKKMMVSEQGSDFQMISKTGLSLSGVGWYVGYVTKGNNVYYFATNLTMKEEIPRNRRIEVTKSSLQVLNIL
jgi:beta-lactamase class D